MNAREIARAATTARDKVLESLAPIRAALDVGEKANPALLAALPKAAAADDDQTALLVFRDAAGAAGALRPMPVPVPEVTGDRPRRLLSLAGKGGTLLSIGGVLLLAGEGGIAKSPLALHVALSMAAQRLPYGGLHGGLFTGSGGPALVATYEDAAPVVADRLRKLAEVADDGLDDALEHVHVLDLAGWPLYGPHEGGLYNARPAELAGWAVLDDAVRHVKPRLVVIDPALAAYAAEANHAAAVREFVTALTLMATREQCGVLLVAHSTKEARRTARSHYDPFDPGHVAGSTHWTDAARGVLTLTYDQRRDADPGARVLAVSKANYGPARLAVMVDPLRSRATDASKGEIVGFTNAGTTWDTWKAKADGDGNTKVATNSAGKVERI